jgi:uncharacterized membrane protein YphA (DoxX/SURF4 family)
MSQLQPWGLLAGRVLLEIVGGPMLVVGWKARRAAGVIFLFVLAANLIFHAYRAVPENQAFMQHILFNRNLAVMGGMQVIACAGPGRLSLDKSQEEAWPSRVTSRDRSCRRPPSTATPSTWRASSPRT